MYRLILSVSLMLCNKITSHEEHRHEELRQTIPVVRQEEHRTTLEGPTLLGKPS
jgi:hypothetical protein